MPDISSAGIFLENPCLTYESHVFISLRLHLGAVHVLHMPCHSHAQRTFPGMQIAITHRLWEQAADKDGSIGWIGFIGSRMKTG
jgi:hypothetical protein